VACLTIHEKIKKKAHKPEWLKNKNFKEGIGKKPRNNKRLLGW